VALPAHPIGTGAAVAGVVEGSDANAIPAIASAVTMRITIVEMRRARKKSKACGTLLRIAFQSRRSHPVRTGGGGIGSLDALAALYSFCRDTAFRTPDVGRGFRIVGEIDLSHDVAQTLMSG
jgi:hypothetical protein